LAYGEAGGVHVFEEGHDDAAGGTEVLAEFAGSGLALCRQIGEDLLAGVVAGGGEEDCFFVEFDDPSGADEEAERAAAGGFAFEFGAARWVEGIGGEFCFQVSHGGGEVVGEAGGESLAAEDRARLGEAGILQRLQEVGEDVFGREGGLDFLSEILQRKTREVGILFVEGGDQSLGGLEHFLPPLGIREVGAELEDGALFDESLDFLREGSGRNFESGGNTVSGGEAGALDEKGDDRRRVFAYFSERGEVFLIGLLAESAASGIDVEDTATGEGGMPGPIPEDETVAHHAVKWFVETELGDDFLAGLERFSFAKNEAGPDRV